MGGFDVSEVWARWGALVALGDQRCGGAQRCRQAAATETRLRLPCLQDLLPAEIASSRKPGHAPMRQGSSAPKPAASSPAGVPPVHEAAPRPCSVDGVPDNVVDAWFQEADKDGDGRVADSEARTFFLTSGLAPADLSKVRRQEGRVVGCSDERQTS